MIGQLEPGTILAGYEIQRPLGRGGMGDVYLARREGETRVVALKLLSTGLAKETRFRDRFERESHMATSLEHPHIVPVYATGEVDGVRYIAMRYVDGPTLRDIIDDDSPLDLRRSLSILGQVASALDDAHAIGLVHRDIKPGNVLIARSGASEFREHAYLADFGVSKYTGSESDFTRTGQFIGTSLYAAPEQIKGERVDGRTDVYAFGCMIFECLTGRVPFEKESEAALLWAQMTEVPRAVSTLRPDVPEALDAVVAKAMSKEASDRFATCGEMVVAAREALASAPPAAVGPPVAAAPTVIRPVEPIPTVAPAPPTVLGTEVSSESDVEPDEAVDEGEGEPEVSTPPAVATVITPVPDLPVVVEEDEQAIDTGEPPSLTVVEDTGAEATRDIETAVPVLAPAAVSAETIVAPPRQEPEPAAPQSSETVVAPPVSPASTTAPAGRSRAIAVGAGVVILLGLAGWLGVSLLSGDGEGSTSETTTPAGAVPRPDAPPTFAGTARVGSTLTADPGTWQGSPSFTFRWRRCNGDGGDCEAIPTATAKRYRLVPADAGRRLRVSVTGENDAGARTTVSKASSVVDPPLRKPTVVTRPTVSGSTVEGDRLTATRGTWRGSGPLDFTYVWLRCHGSADPCVVVQGATGRTYDIRSADIDHRIRVEVRASGPGGKATARSNPTPVVRGQQVITTTNTTTSPPPTTTTQTITTVPDPP